MSNLLNTELLSEISEVRLMPKGERVAMSVVLQWSPDDYRIGARCKVQGAITQNWKILSIHFFLNLWSTKVDFWDL